MRHKHADLIHAWAEGAEIQYRSDAAWVDVSKNNPYWDSYCEYRIKPAPKPDVVRYVWVSGETGTCCSYAARKKLANHNIALTFDGETGKLKSAEVL